MVPTEVAILKLTVKQDRQYKMHRLAITALSLLTDPKILRQERPPRDFWRRQPSTDYSSPQYLHPDLLRIDDTTDLLDFGHGYASPPDDRSLQVLYLRSGSAPFNLSGIYWGKTVGMLAWLT